jgi:integrase
MMKKKELTAHKTGQGVWQMAWSERGKKITLYLGKYLPEKTACEYAAVVSDLVNCRRAGNRVSPEILVRFHGLPKNIKESLERFELVRPVEMSELCEKHEKTKEGMKKGTIQHYRSWYFLLKEEFGERELKTIEKTDAETFRKKCLAKLSPSSVSRGLRTCKSVFQYAFDLGLILRNPFDGVKGSGEVNESRSVYVSRNKIEKVLEYCRNDKERLMISLGRFAGLRIPSEIRHMRFRDFDGDVIRIHEETKTGARTVPLFRDIRTVFERLKGNPDDLIFLDWFPSTEAWKILLRAVEKSGVERWPKLFVNLRSSCITEFDNLGYTEKALDSMFGNSAKIRRKHYVQLFKDREYRKMIEDNERIIDYLCENGGTFSGEVDPLTLRDVYNRTVLTPRISDLVLSSKIEPEKALKGVQNR